MKSFLANTYEPKISAWITDNIKSYNDARSPHHLASRKENAKKYLSLVKYDDEALMGGLLGQLYWRWLKIDELFVDEVYRNAGLGTQLVEKAMQIAVDHNCQKVLVHTFSFQAVAFYERLGFQTVGQLKDYPPGASLYSLTRNLM